MSEKDNIKSCKKSISSTVMMTVNSNTDKAPHCLWHLTQREWVRMKDYSICLSELFVGNISVYNNVSFGAKVIAPLKKYIAWQHNPLARNQFI